MSEEQEPGFLWKLNKALLMLLKTSLIGIIAYFGLVVFFILIMLLGMNPHIGWFPESGFRLSENSPLPRWFTLPEGCSRNESSIEISYYSPIYGDDVKAILYCRGNKVAKVIGTHKSVNPDAPNDAYPHYYETTLDGITEIVEHRERGPVFYISSIPSTETKIKTP